MIKFKSILIKKGQKLINKTMFTIRDYNSNDLEGGKAVLVNGLEEHKYIPKEYTDKWINEFAKEILENFQIPNKESPKGGFFVVESTDNNKVIGIVGLEAKPNKEAELRRMYILKEERGKKIGGKLVKHVLDFAKKEGFEKVNLYTAEVGGAGLFYEKCGFKLVEEIIHKIENSKHKETKVFKYEYKL
jgi:N-acetylglutamate synthase-like GNAT family acetyltransferase